MMNDLAEAMREAAEILHEIGGYSALVDDLRYGAAELEGMMLFPKMEWRPIETAPVDGKAFLVWVPENKCVFEVISRSYKGAAQMTLFGSFGLEFTHNATHWMPLPAAPGAGGG